jgi:adenine phosphoribosyltransferase
MIDFDLDKAIRKVPDFPKPGILFYDVTSILTNREAFKWIIDKAIDVFESSGYDTLLAVESRGFIFASPMAYLTGKPIVLARKSGKLPGKTISQSYALEYGEATLEIHSDDIQPGNRVLIIDDLIATGGTLKACTKMVEKLGASVTGIFGVIGLPFLDYEKVLEGYSVTTLHNYHGE